jgi:phospholipase/carboxylesterase
MPEPDTLRSCLPAGREQDIFIAHGTLDQLVPVEEARSARRFLEAEGFRIEYHEYEIAHQVAAEELADLVRWLHRVLPPADTGNLP